MLTLSVIIIVIVTLGTFHLVSHKKVSAMLEFWTDLNIQNTEKRMSRLALKLLENNDACTNSFPNRENPVRNGDWYEYTSRNIKNSLNDSVYNLGVSGSALDEVGALKLLKIRIKTPSDRKMKDSQYRATHTSYEDPLYRGHFHKVVPIELLFSFHGRVRPPVVSKVYLYTKGNAQNEEMKACSTASLMLDRLGCGRVEVDVICCRYQYKLSLDPEDFKNNPNIVQNERFVIGATNNRDRREGGMLTEKKPPNHYDCLYGVGNRPCDGVRTDCESSATKAKLTGICTFDNGWVLEKKCER